MTKHARLMEVAYAVALTSPGIGPNNMFRLGAVLVKKNRVLATGVNSRKTHPLLSRFGKFPICHAESATIIRQGLDHCSGCDLYVCRIKKNYQRDLLWGLARPCSLCYDLICGVDIRRVYYSTNEQTIVEMKV